MKTENNINVNACSIGEKTKRVQIQMKLCLSVLTSAPFVCAVLIHVVSASVVYVFPDQINRPRTQRHGRLCECASRRNNAVVTIIPPDVLKGAPRNQNKTKPNQNKTKPKLNQNKTETLRITRRDWKDASVFGEEASVV